jgi:hypothetical protein
MAALLSAGYLAMAALLSAGYLAMASYANLTPECTQAGRD